MSAQHTPKAEPAWQWREAHRIRRGHPVPYCRECRGAGDSLTRHCVGRMLTDDEERRIAAGEWNFADGEWVGRAAIAATGQKGE